MKKTNNKGFSLVELIIVIAIMAILAGAIAPALIRYIDKSRKSNDVSSAKTIKTAIETAMSNEATYELLTEKGTDNGLAASNVDNGVQIEAASCIQIKAGGKAATATADVTITTNLNPVPNGVMADAQNEIGKNIGENFPKVKYKKDAAEAANGTAFLTASGCDWYAYISEGGSVFVGIGDGSKFYSLAPEVSKYYQ